MTKQPRKGSIPATSGEMAFSVRLMQYEANLQRAKEAATKAADQQTAQAAIADAEQAIDDLRATGNHATRARWYSNTSNPRNYTAMLGLNDPRRREMRRRRQELGLPGYKEGDFQRSAMYEILLASDLEAAEKGGSKASDRFFQLVEQLNQTQDERRIEEILLELREARAAFEQEERKRTKFEQESTRTDAVTDTQATD